MKRLFWGCGVLLLTSCASHTPSDMSETADGSEGAPYTQTAGGPGGRHGGSNSLWSDVFRTALQTGMGFIHH
ncbi:hypothetical protein BAR24_01460 [Gluconobacter oxydans]|uniref:hypothetical protein n=1 Tax=Gluconobacter thailandicus TaxID=257438 RepID=UPI0003186238|nr:hypothetical protein [Gluconobacter thailandicus]ANQ40241.1 hypothetical protein BAR24_01460 [Gluconobacter oxydans]